MQNLSCNYLKWLFDFLQASKHPFVTGEPFTHPYMPPPETPQMVSKSPF